MARLRETPTVQHQDPHDTLAGVAHHIPVFPAGPADMHDVLGVMARLPGDGNQVDGKAFVDQKPYDTAMVSIRRRARCEGF